MSVTINYHREEVEFTGKRIRYYSQRSFDEVLANLRARIGEITIENLLGETETREEFEQKIQKYVGDSGFMLMTQMDHGRWIENFGIKRRLVRWIFGNPLVAITMIRHDYTAGLFVPPDLLLAENNDGPGCNITYVLPSSLIVIEENPELRTAALALDAKIEAFITSAI